MLTTNMAAQPELLINNSILMSDSFPSPMYHSLDNFMSHCPYIITVHHHVPFPWWPLHILKKKTYTIIIIHVEIISKTFHLQNDKLPISKN